MTVESEKWPGTDMTVVLIRGTPFSSCEVLIHSPEPVTAALHGKSIWDGEIILYGSDKPKCSCQGLYEKGPGESASGSRIG